MKIKFNNSIIEVYSFTANYLTFTRYLHFDDAVTAFTKKIEGCIFEDYGIKVQASHIVVCLKKLNPLLRATGSEILRLKIGTDELSALIKHIIRNIN